jgi:NMD protein affecting ribosome stability and mRNA decay
MGENRNETPRRESRRRDRLIREREHDTYKVRGKLPDPTACPECGAIYRDGRWMCGPAPEGANEVACPACQRIRDRYPGGYLALSGGFLTEHGAEIIALAHNVEAREKQQHPLKRIMEIEESEHAFEITVTHPNLARAIGEAVHRAYQGELDFHYTDEENVLRVRWHRS